MFRFQGPKWGIAVLTAILTASLDGGRFCRAQNFGHAQEIETAKMHLRSPNRDIAYRAGKLLAELRGESLPAFGVLVQVAQHSQDLETVKVCVWAIGRIAESVGAKLSYSDAQSIAPFLIRTIKDKNKQPALRQVCAYGVGRLSETLEGASTGQDILLTQTVDTLTKVIGDDGASAEQERIDFQRTVAEALGRFRSDARVAVNNLDNALIQVTNDLNEKTDDKDRTNRLLQLQGAIAEALGQMGPEAGSAVPLLAVMLKGDPRGARSAAYALRNLGPSARQAAPDLIGALQSAEPAVRQVAAFALDRVKPQTDEALYALIRALQDGNPGVREAAAAALGTFTPIQSRQAILPLRTALADGDPYVRAATATTLGAIAEKIAKSSDRPTARKAIRDLEHAQEDVSQARNTILPTDPSFDTFNDALFETQQAIQDLKGTWVRNFYEQHGALAWSLTTLAAAFALWFLCLRLLIMKFCPIRIMEWNQVLEEVIDIDVTLPYGLHLKIPLRYFVLVGFFNYHGRVLDAWVDRHSGIALRNFTKYKTVKDRETYVDIPVKLEDRISTTIPQLTPGDLHSTCAQDRWCIRIIGEGGAGKTTLALQLARWSLDEYPAHRLCPDRKAIPVLLERQLRVDADNPAKSWKTLIRIQLKEVTGRAELVPEPLFDHLLQTRRILVIVDGASEMDQFATASERRLRIEASFPATALIVTARSYETFGGGAYTDILPLRVESDRLFRFIDAYLLKVQLQLDDPKLYEACQRLSLMVGKDRGITPLLGQLYARSLVKAYRKDSSRIDLPQSVPELMLEYLDGLNGSPDNQGSRDLYTVAERMAWECIRAKFRPGRGRQERLLSESGPEAVSAEMLTDFEKRLCIIERGRDQKFQFLLDPLAEYLAALYLVRKNGSDAEKWDQFLRDADSMPGAPGEILGFLIAVCDAIAWKEDDYEIPSFVQPELNLRISYAREPLNRRAVDQEKDPALLQQENIPAHT